MKKSKKIVKTVFNVLFVVFMVVLAAVIALSVYAKTTGKHLLSYTVLWVLTDSMEETIPAQSYVLVKEAKASEVKVGDIVTFRSRDPAIMGQLNTHRVVEIVTAGEEFVTRGDNAYSDDPYHVYGEDVVAIYRCNLPVLTFFGRLYAKPMGITVTLVVLMIGASVWFSVVTKKARKEAEKADFEARVAEEVARLEAAAKREKDMSEGIFPDDNNGQR